MNEKSFVREVRQEMMERMQPRPIVRNAKHHIAYMLATASTFFENIFEDTNLAEL